MQNEWAAAGEIMKVLGSRWGKISCKIGGQWVGDVGDSAGNFLGGGTELVRNTALRIIGDIFFRIIELFLKLPSSRGLLKDSRIVEKQRHELKYTEIKKMELKSLTQMSTVLSLINF